MLKYSLRFIGRYLALFLALAALWLLLSGYFAKATLLVFGLASVLTSLWLALRAGMLDREGVPTRIFPGILGYMVWLTVEIGKANVAVLLHALSPKLALSPKIVSVPARQESDVCKVIFANSITLTPGTVSLDLAEDRILVHALTEELADVDGMRQMGEKVCALDGRDGRASARVLRREV